VSYLLGQLDPHGYPVTSVTVRPAPHAHVATHPAPMPAVQVVAVIDTGANHSAVSPDVVRSLGIEPMGAAEVNRVGVNGAVIYMYPVRIELQATMGMFAPFDLGAAGIKPSTLGADVILGLDILRAFTFTYRGPRSLSDFTLFLEDAAPPWDDRGRHVARRGSA
jgi:gag-polyprotein putative aspartyl protease